MENLVNALDDFKDKNILVIGDIILDKYSTGTCRTNPEQPGSYLIKIEKGEYSLGGAANVANNIASLGGNCSLYGIVEDDEFGNTIKNLCRLNKITLIGFSSGTQTIIKERFIEKSRMHYLGRVDRGEVALEKADYKIQENIMHFLNQNVENIDLIILSDYDKRVFGKELSQKIINLANSKGVRTLVDSKPSNLMCFENCSIIRPNKKEASEMTGIKYSNGEGVLNAMAKKLCEKVNAKHSIITCGKDGVFCYENGTGESLMVETKARRVADVTGAGDTFAAIIALGLAVGLKMHDAIKLANYGSGVVVEKLGTAVPTIEEIKKKIERDKKI